MKLWLPVILFLDKQGRPHYESHGTFDTMVSTKAKRADCEFDFLNCFEIGGSTPSDADIDSAQLVWIQTEVEYPPQRRTYKDLYWRPSKIIKLRPA